MGLHGGGGRVVLKHYDDLTLVVNEAIGWKCSGDRGVFSALVTVCPFFLVILGIHLAHLKLSNLRCAGGFHSSLLT